MDGQRRPLSRCSAEPDASYHGLVYADRFGRGAFTARLRSVYQRTTGAVLAPMSAFLLLQGHRDRRAAGRTARRERREPSPISCVSHPQVAWVNYAGFADSPHYPMATKYLGGRASSLLTFGVVGGFEAGKAFYDALS